MGIFKVDAKVFETLPGYCLGVIIARGIDNSRPNERIGELMKEREAAFYEQYRDVNIRELPSVNAYREAFRAAGINPNKFMCSIEALGKRVQKGNLLPQINPIVDLGNVCSLKYLVPLGAHDIDHMENETIEIRFSTPEDHFLPMGEETEEGMPEGELVYVSGHTVKTRRFMWRQSEDGKITDHSGNIFFPLDGFEDVNEQEVLAAREEIAGLLQEEFSCDLQLGFVNAANSEMQF